MGEVWGHKLWELAAQRCYLLITDAEVAKVVTWDCAESQSRISECRLWCWQCESILLWGRPGTLIKMLTATQFEQLQALAHSVVADHGHHPWRHQRLFFSARPSDNKTPALIWMQKLRKIHKRFFPRNHFHTKCVITTPRLLGSTAATSSSPPGTDNQLETSSLWRWSFNIRTMDFCWNWSGETRWKTQNWSKSQSGTFRWNGNSCLSCRSVSSLGEQPIRN